MFKKYVHGLFALQSHLPRNLFFKGKFQWPVLQTNTIQGHVSKTQTRPRIVVSKNSGPGAGSLKKKQPLDRFFDKFGPGAE